MNSQSRPVVIVEYRDRWPDEFLLLAARIRELVGTSAIRIDHIGSTAVRGLGAKDVLDIQVTVADLDRAADVTVPLRAAGFRKGDEFVFDQSRGKAEADPDLRKLYMREPESERRVHIHIRERGRFNQRYALLFRDYLRASAGVRVEYELLKRRAARVFPDSIDGYLDLKDPVFHIIFEAATLWARIVSWEPDGDYS